jgi:hypothetical protein
MGAMKEAFKCLSKVTDSPNKSAKLSSLQQRIGAIGMFVQARKCSATELSESLKLCQTLLAESTEVSAMA